MGHPSKTIVFRSRPGKPNQRKGPKDEKFMNRGVHPFLVPDMILDVFPWEEASTIHIELLFRNAPEESSTELTLFFGLWSCFRGSLLSIFCDVIITLRQPKINCSKIRCWKSKFLYRYRPEGIFRIFFRPDSGPPPVHMLLQRKKANSFVPAIFIPMAWPF